MTPTPTRIDQARQDLALQTELLDIEAAYLDAKAAHQAAPHDAQLADAYRQAKAKFSETRTFWRTVAANAGFRFPDGGAVANNPTEES